MDFATSAPKDTILTKMACASLSARLNTATFVHLLQLAIFAKKVTVLTTTLASLFVTIPTVIFVPQSTNAVSVWRVMKRMAMACAS
jgi:hypothetical protein